MIVTIPIKPHLKKFIMNGRRRHKEPIKLTERTSLGQCIMRTLMEKRSHKFDNVKEQYTARLTVILTKEMSERSPRLHKMINLSVEYDIIFKEALYVWVEAQSKQGVPEYEACKNFVDHYKITPEEYSYDAAERAWRRYKNIEELRQKEKAQQVS